ncbi:MAG: hypothetical protein OEY67_02235 [Gammaproteobacteria bacterium]|nr:hypothetical protein [Gammaproteobacteria bacterium]
MSKKSEESNVQPIVPANPDLGWSQVRETVMMLNLSVAQIEKSMSGGDDSVTALAESFTSVVGNTKVIAQAANSLSGSKEKDIIEDHCKSVTERVQAAIIAFQFYDILAQRLSHVSYSLESLAALINDPEKLYSPYEWLGLQEMIKSKYTLDADKAMFEAIINGATVEEALKISEEYRSQSKARDDDIEMF